MTLSLISEKDGVYTLTLNAPEKLNAMSYELLGELSQNLGVVRNDKQAKAVILTGAGRGFSAGAELAAMDSRMGNDGFGAGVAHLMHTVCSPVIEAIRNMPVPVIGAVNGPAVGGGFGLAIACHIVIAARSAYFSLPFVPRLGLMPDMGATWFLPRYVGRARALSLCLLGERLSSAEAAEIGLIHQCVEDANLMQEAHALAAKMARLPAGVFGELCDAFGLSEHNTLTEQLAFEADRQGVLIERPAFKDGVAEFMKARTTKSS